MEPLLDNKLRLLCSYGGRIMPLPPAKPLHYVGGQTRLVQVPRGLSFNAFFELLSSKLLSGRPFSLKYRLPGCDLDSLITVSDKDDLQNMIHEYDSIRFRRIRLFLFPLNYPEPTQHSMSVNRLLGLSFNSSASSVLPPPMLPSNNAPAAQCTGHGKVDSTAEENQKQNEGPTASPSLSSLPENTAVDAGSVSDKETEKVEIQDQARPTVQEPLPPQQQLFVVYYVPVLAMQPHTLTHPVAPYTSTPAVEHSSRLDPAAGDRENVT